MSRLAILSRPFTVSGSKGSVGRDIENDAGEYAKDRICEANLRIQARQVSESCENMSPR